MATETWQIASSADDCFAWTYNDVWQFSLTHTLVSAGRSSAPYDLMGSGMRFVSITLARRATIKSAYLTFTVGGVAPNTGTVVRTRISAEDIGNAPIFINDVDVFFDRFDNHTSAIVDWDSISPWYYPNSYNSVDITSVIQEVVNRDDWVLGNSIVLFWEDFDARGDSVGGQTVLRHASSYDHSPSNSPTLTVEYAPLARPLETHLTPTRLYKTTLTPEHLYEAVLTPEHLYKATLEPTHLYEASLKPKRAVTYKGTLEASHGYEGSLEAKHNYARTLVAEHKYETKMEVEHKYTAKMEAK